MSHNKFRIAAALAAFAALALPLTACGGSDDSKPSIGLGTSNISAPKGVKVYDGDQYTSAAWGKNEDAPAYAITLVQEIDLPTEFDVVIDDPDRLEGPITPYHDIQAGLTQYQGGNVGLVVPLYNPGNRTETDLLIAVISPEGEVVSTTRYPYAQGGYPIAFDEAETTTSGYARVEAAEGSNIEIPSAAAGNKPGKAYMTSVMPDAVDDKTVWVTLRGSSSIYKAEVRQAD